VKRRGQARIAVLRGGRREMVRLGHQCAVDVRKRSGRQSEDALRRPYKQSVLASGSEHAPGAKARHGALTDTADGDERDG